jgi:hypothetical protein
VGDVRIAIMRAMDGFIINLRCSSSYARIAISLHRSYLSSSIDAAIYILFCVIVQTTNREKRARGQAKSKGHCLKDHCNIKIIDKANGEWWLVEPNSVRCVGGGEDG